MSMLTDSISVKVQTDFCLNLKYVNQMEVNNILQLSQLQVFRNQICILKYI